MSDNKEKDIDSDEALATAQNERSIAQTELLALKPMLIDKSSMDDVDVVMKDIQEPSHQGLAGIISYNCASIDIK